MPDRRSRAEARPDARFPIRLVALDLDGTLIEDDGPIRERTRRAVAATVALGVPVIIATGRMPTSVRPFVEALGLRTPIIGYQGGLVREVPAEGRRLGRMLFHRAMAADVARAAIEWCDANGFRPHINHLERFIVGIDDPNVEDYSKFLGARAEIVPDVARWVRHPVTKVIAVAEAGRPEAFLEGVRELFAGRAEVTVSHPQFIEFLAPGVSKGRAVRWFARRSGVAMDQVLAIGDQHNDTSMLAVAGHGVAMPSAPEDVRAAARYVAPPVEDEGAAQMLEELVLAGVDAPRNAERFLIAGERHADGERPAP
ncbi:MAG TPA: Cof-type HAD-IIB family hydrolase [Candidatus Limnocylindrales bacterium]